MIETDRTKLIKLLRMFSSTLDGEVASAARRAHELVKGRRLDWDELIVKDGAAGSSRTRRSHTTSQIDGFIESIAGSILEWGRLTPKQQGVLDRITKLKLAGLWEGEAW